GLVAGGLLAAQVLRRPRWPWLAAVGAVVVGLLVHSALASSHLVAHGSEIALLGTGGPKRVATMMGVGLRHPLILGPLVWRLVVGCADWRHCDAEAVRGEVDLEHGSLTGGHVTALVKTLRVGEEQGPAFASNCLPSFTRKEAGDVAIGEAPSVHELRRLL